MGHGSEESCHIRFTWCNPRCDTLYKEHHTHQNRVHIVTRGLDRFLSVTHSLKVIPKHLVLCEAFEASHLGC